MLFSFKLCICQDPRIARAYTAQNTKVCALLAYLAQPTYPMPARCGTDTAGRGAFEPPTEDGPRMKLQVFDLEFQFRESHTEAETEKTPDRIPPQNNDRIYQVYKGFARMLRVGQGSTSTCSIHNSIESKNRYHTTHSLRV